MTAAIAADPPADLSAAQRQKWCELHSILARRGPVDEFALDMLKQYCDAWQLRRDAIIAMRSEVGLLDRATNGMRFPKPFLKVLELAEKAMDRVFRRLHVDAGAASDADGFDAF